jgi:glycosyltransferase involved in cell wall biosynthesis
MHIYQERDAGVHPLKDLAVYTECYMKLLLVIPLAGSVQAFFAELVYKLVSRGIEVHCACSGEVPELARGSVRIVFHDISIPRGMNPSGHTTAARELRKIVANVRPDLIHVHFSAAIFTAAMARRSDWPLLVGTFHGLAFPLVKGWRRLLVSFAERWAARRLDRAWVLTQDDNALLARTLRAGRSGVVSPFGVGCDLEKFDRQSFDDTKIASIRTELGIGPETFAFVFVGRFVDFKGFGDVVRTFLSISDRCPEAVLLLAGALDPTHPSGLSDAELEQMRRSNRVLDLGFRNDVDRLLAAANAMVFPSDREGVPVCVMEALAMGCPVITKDARGCRDVVRNGVDGIVVQDGDTDGLANAMILAYSNRAKIAAMAEQAKIGRERFDRGIFVSKQIQEYEKLLESRV